MEEKSFKTIDELIELLKTRGVNIKNYNYAENVLKSYGYYNLINGYNELFLDKTSSEVKYISGTSIEEIAHLYNFDDTLRNIFLRYILKVETKIKSLISYHFSEVHGHQNYLVYTNFDTSLKDSEKSITNLISDVQRQLAHKSNDPSIFHYLSRHGYIPLWVLINILTLGTISKFYSLMLPKERQTISRKYGIMDNQLTNLLEYISKIRNFCAHGNRLYCFRSTRALISTDFHSKLKIEKNSGTEYLKGKRDLFACVIALKILLSDDDFKEMSEELNIAINNLKSNLTVLEIESVLNKMGFPENWSEVNI